MPPPKLGPIKKRKSKRSVDFGRIKSAPTTPTETSPIKEEGQNRCESKLATPAANERSSSNVNPELF